MQGQIECISLWNPWSLALPLCIKFSKRKRKGSTTDDDLLVGDGPI